MVEWRYRIPIYVVLVAQLVGLPRMAVAPRVLTRQGIPSDVSNVMSNGAAGSVVTSEIRSHLDVDGKGQGINAEGHEGGPASTFDASIHDPLDYLTALSRYFKILDVMTAHDDSVALRTIQIAALPAQRYKATTTGERRVDFRSRLDPTRHNYTELLFALPPDVDTRGRRPFVSVCVTSQTEPCVTQAVPRVELRRFGPTAHAWLVLDVTDLLPKDQTTLSMSLTFMYNSSDGTLKEVINLYGTPFLVFYTNKLVLDRLEMAGQELNGRYRRAANDNVNWLQDTVATCRVHPWRVSVQDVGLNGVVFQPERLDIGYCDGDCDFDPLTVNATEISHNAYIRGVYLKRLGRAGRKTSRVPAPACVAVRLQPLSVLYFDEGMVKYSHLPDMIVTRCRCL